MNFLCSQCSNQNNFSNKINLVQPSCRTLDSSLSYRFGADHRRWTSNCWLAGGTYWDRLHPENQGEPQELGLRGLSGLHLRAGQRRLRPGQDVGQTAELYVPVSTRYQETDEEIRTERSSLCIHLSEPLPEVLF